MYRQWSWKDILKRRHLSTALNEVRTHLSFSLHSKKSRRLVKLLCLELEVRTVRELRNLGNIISIFKQVIRKLKIDHFLNINFLELSVLGKRAWTFLGPCYRLQNGFLERLCSFTFPPAGHISTHIFILSPTLSNNIFFTVSANLIGKNGILFPFVWLWLLRDNTHLKLTLLNLYKNSRVPRDKIHNKVLRDPEMKTHSGHLHKNNSHLSNWYIYFLTIFNCKIWHIEHCIS